VSSGSRKIGNEALHELSIRSNYKQIDNPYWLAEFSTFITDTMTADFQAVLMGDKSAAACLKGWADLIDGYQAEYLSSLK
jgi:hypothetical protein